MCTDHFRIHSFTIKGSECPVKVLCKDMELGKKSEKERERGVTTRLHTAGTESQHGYHQACGYYHVFYYMLQHVVVVYGQVRQR